MALFAEFLDVRRSPEAPTSVGHTNASIPTPRVGPSGGFEKLDEVARGIR